MILSLYFLNLLLFWKHCLLLGLICKYQIITFFYFPRLFVILKTLVSLSLLQNLVVIKEHSFFSYLLLV